MLMIDRDEGLWHPKILLAEDDTAVRRSLQLLLLGQNLDVRSYATSSELIADETNRDALCLISDYRMPGLDGISLLRQMRFLGRSEEHTSALRSLMRISYAISCY